VSNDERAKAAIVTAEANQSRRMGKAKGTPIKAKAR